MTPRKIAVILALALVGASRGFDEHGAIESAVDRFGDPLPPGALLRLGTERLRHNHHVRGVAFSPDGKMLASVGWGDYIRVSDRRTGKTVRELRNATEGTASVAFSPDGTQLATGGMHGTVTLWDVATGKTIFKNKEHSDCVHALAFSPDARSFASAGGSIRVWNAVTGAEVLKLPSPPKFRSGDSQGVAFSPDGKLLAGSFRERIHIWDVKQGTPPIVIAKAHTPIVTSLIFSDNKTLISAGHSVVRSWDAATGAQVRELKAESGHGGSLALSSDGKILSAAYWNKIRIWNNRTGESIRTITDYRDTFIPQAHGLAIAPDGETLAAGAEDNVVRLWDVATGKQTVNFLDSHTDRINSVAYSPDARLVLTGADGSVRLWDASNSKQVRSLSFGTRSRFGEVVAAFSADGKTIAAGGYDDSPEKRFAGSCRLWDAATGKELRIQGFPHRVTALAFSPDDKTLAIATLNTASDLEMGYTIFVWNVSTGKEPVLLATNQSDVHWLAFLPTGKTLATIQQGQLHLWDVPTKKEKTPLLQAGARLNSAVFSADGKIVVTSGMDGGELVVWDVATETELRRMEVKNTMGSMLAWSRDGRILASAPIPRSFTDYELDGSIHLWEMLTGQTIRKLQPGTSKVTTLAFAPGARTLISGKENGTALIWNIKPASTKALSPKELERLWTDLAGADAGQAYAAIGVLSAKPETSIPFLKTRLLPSPEVPAARVRTLIAELGSGEFRVREAAYKELEKFEEPAAGLLRDALAKNPTLEVRRRLESLLAAVHNLKSGQTVRRLRALQVLEDIGSNEARRILQTLAKGLRATREAEDARASLERLQRPKN